MKPIKKIDWRKHDTKAPQSTYVRLAKPGDVLKFPHDPTYYQVEKIIQRGEFIWKVKYYNMNQWCSVAPKDRARLFFRFANRDKVEDLTVS